MKTYINKLYLLCLTMLVLIMAGCNKNDNSSSLSLNGDTFIDKIVLDDKYEGVIDNKNANIIISVPYAYDTKAMTVSQLVLSEGAEATLNVGDKINFSYSQSVRVTMEMHFLIII